MNLDKVIPWNGIRKVIGPYNYISIQQPLNSKPFCYNFGAWQEKINWNGLPFFNPWNNGKCPNYIKILIKFPSPKIFIKLPESNKTCYIYIYWQIVLLLRRIDVGGTFTNLSWLLMARVGSWVYLGFYEQQDNVSSRR